MPGPQARLVPADAWASDAVSFSHLAALESDGLSSAGSAAARAALTIDFRAAGIGAIQVPAAGEPILLMADRQTAGGYPKIGYVITADLPLAGQLAPGDFIEFDLCTEPRRWRP